MARIDRIAQQVLKGLQSAILLKKAREDAAAQAALKRAQALADLMRLQIAREELDIRKREAEGLAKLREAQIRRMEAELKRPIRVGGALFLPEEKRWEVAPTVPSPAEQARAAYWETARKRMIRELSFETARRRRLNQLLNKLREGQELTEADRLELAALGVSPTLLRVTPTAEGYQPQSTFGKLVWDAVNAPDERMRQLLMKRAQAEIERYGDFTISQALEQREELLRRLREKGFQLPPEAQATYLLTGRLYASTLRAGQQRELEKQEAARIPFEAYARLIGPGVKPTEDLLNAWKQSVEANIDYYRQIGRDDLAEVVRQSYNQYLRDRIAQLGMHRRLRPDWGAEQVYQAFRIPAPGEAVQSVVPAPTPRKIPAEETLFDIWNKYPTPQPGLRVPLPRTTR